jgi:RNA polymerase sigma-70 factor (ECF subfamily)
MKINPAETLMRLVEDQQAFAKALTRLYRVALHMVHNHHDAEDLVQQSLVKALQGEQTFAGQCLVITWLRQIVRNLAHDFLRHHRRFPQVSLEDEAASELTANFETALNDQMDGARILAALPTVLTPTEAEVVRCYYEHGWSSEEIARLFAKTPAAIRQLHSRALMKLRHHFTHDRHDETENPKTGKHSGRLF